MEGTNARCNIPNQERSGSNGLMQTMNKNKGLERAAPSDGYHRHGIRQVVVIRMWCRVAEEPSMRSEEQVRYPFQDDQGAQEDKCSDLLSLSSLVLNQVTKASHRPFAARRVVTFGAARTSLSCSTVATRAGSERLCAGV